MRQWLLVPAAAPFFDGTMERGQNALAFPEIVFAHNSFTQNARDAARLGCSAHKLDVDSSVTSGCRPAACLASFSAETTQFPVAPEIWVGDDRGGGEGESLASRVSAASGIPFASTLRRDRDVKKIIDNRATIK
jgi:hypothetical protein